MHIFDPKLLVDTLPTDPFVFNKAVFEGEREVTQTALFALMNLLDVPGKVTFCKAFSTKIALDLDRLGLVLSHGSGLVLSPGRFD